MPSISAPIIAAGLIGAGSVASAVIGGNAAQSAASTEAAAANNATNTTLGIYNQTRSDLAPYNTTGQSAISQLASLFGVGTGGAAGTGPTASTAANATSALTQYPGYQFGLQQGQSALASSAAAQGLLLSGGQLAAQNTYGQNYAMQNAWQPYISQLSSLAGLGENAAAQTGNAGSSAAATASQSTMAAGQATASGIMGSSNALTSGIQSGLQNASLIALLQGQGGTAGTGGSS